MITCDLVPTDPVHTTQANISTVSIAAHEDLDTYPQGVYSRLHELLTPNSS